MNYLTNEDTIRISFKELCDTCHKCGSEPALFHYGGKKILGCLWCSGNDVAEITLVDAIRSWNLLQREKLDRTKTRKIVFKYKPKGITWQCA